MRRFGAIAVLLGTCMPGPRADAAVHAAPPAEVALRDDEDAERRRQLTEREDKRRPEQPWTVDIAGRPLTVSGEVGFDLTHVRPHSLTGQRSGRSLLESGVEAEAFYSLTPALSLFAQARARFDRERGASSRISTRYLERGEMWLAIKDIADSPFGLEIGRLKFEDERRWWWDEELDAVRATVESKGVEADLALARELGRTRTDLDVAPEQNRVRRVLAQAAWKAGPDLELLMFALRHDDRSPAERIGQLVASKAQDESDARLTWLGIGFKSDTDLRSVGLNAVRLTAELDAARVRGHERVVEYRTLGPADSAAVSAVDSVSRRDVRGWAVDAVLRWTLPLSRAPRLVTGYAIGSGGASSGDDRAFRQTGLHANEAGFGGVKRFAHYGAALDPELSNLRIVTIGAGASLLAASSIDLVYHRYAQAKPATSLRSARVPAELNGVSRNVGSGFDLVLAVEEWERVEFSVLASSFRAGPAFGKQEGRRHWFGALALRVAF